MPDNHTSESSQPPTPDANPDKKSDKPFIDLDKPLSDEDKVVLGFSLLGLLGSVPLYMLHVPSIIISIFLSAGITALVYRFLGGLSEATFVMGAMRLGGAIAAVVGVAFWINSTHQLDPQQSFRLASDEAMVGEWDWQAVGPNTGWDGHLNFVKVSGKLTFTGTEYSLEKGAYGTNYKPVFEMTNGKATLINNNQLILESDVKDFIWNRTFHWKSVEPLILAQTFGGKLRPIKPDDPNLEANPWGIQITKKPY